MGLTIFIQEDATGRLRRMAADLTAQEVSMVAGRAVANLLRAHFRGLEQRPQKDGWWKRLNPGQWPKTHFWSQVRNSTQNPQHDGPDGAVVSINHVGFAQRLRGGPISARKSKFLTIPVHPQAYGKRAREMDLHFSRYDPDTGQFGSGPALVLVVGAGGLTRARTVKGQVKQVAVKGVKAGDIMFCLVREVSQPADPSVLPADGVVRAAIDRDVGDFVRRTLERKGLTQSTSA